MSGAYGSSDDDESIATIRAALDNGMTLLDTGDFYGSGHNEMLIARALGGTARQEVQLSVKFGGLRDPDGRWIGLDARPVAVANSLAYTLQRLGTDYVDIYRPARLDPAVPIEETTGAIADQVTRGHVRHIGLSEVDADTIRGAAAVHPICDVQVEYSLLSREIEDEILPTCRELGIGITAYGVLSRGLITDALNSPPDAPGDLRRHLPRFQAANFEHNRTLIDALAAIAAAKDATVAQLAIAWVAAQGNDIVPLIGTRQRHRLDESLGALEIELTAADLATIERTVPPGAAAGSRYSS
jgi:aryl-alcohol dehydrogenase-like predicted oxidoreductase